MTIQQLSFFTVVAKYLHFGEAAKALYVAQPALSHSISSLEDELDVKLFFRTSRRVELTAAGKVFLEGAAAIIERLNSTVSTAKLAESGCVGSLQIGMLGGLSKGRFPRIISSFKSKYPQVFVSLTQSNAATLTRKLIMGELDIALTRAVCVESKSEFLSYHKYADDRYAVFMREDNPRAGRGVDDLSYLADETLIVLDRDVSPEVHDYTLRICAARGLSPQAMTPAPSLEVVCTFVKAGLGVAVLPSIAKSYCDDQLAVTELTGDDSILDIVFAWRKKNLNPIVPNFLDEI